MAQTYDPIATQTLGSPASAISFASIPAGYTDLVLVISSAGCTNSTASIYYRFNSDGASNYSMTELNGNGTSAASARVSPYTLAFLNQINPGTADFNIVTHLMNYSSASANKVILSRVNIVGAFTSLNANLWRSTAAINNIQLGVTVGNFATGTKATLFGIKAA